VLASSIKHTMPRPVCSKGSARVAAYRTAAAYRGLAFRNAWQQGDCESPSARSGGPPDAPRPKKCGGRAFARGSEGLRGEVAGEDCFKAAPSLPSPADQGTSPTYQGANL
jgi:hypothetical protein